MLSSGQQPMDTYPRQVHLAYAGDAGSTMAVGWQTANATAGSQPVVRYGTVPSALSSNATGVTSQYFESLHHDAVLVGLAPATQYWYTVGDGSTFLAAPRTFRTGAATGDDGAFKCSIFGDMGVNNSAATIARLAALPSHEFAIHVGDISYADDLALPGEPSGAGKYDGGRGYERVYDLWGEMIEGISSAKPYFVSPGNHDVSCHVTSDIGCIKGHRNFTAFNYRFRMPSQESGAAPAAPAAPALALATTPTTTLAAPAAKAAEAAEASSSSSSSSAAAAAASAAAAVASPRTQPHFNMWYSFTAHRTHFVSLDTESDFPGAPTTPKTLVGGGKGGGWSANQLAWLDADLGAARAAGSGVDWVVVYGHRPMYASVADAKDWPVNAVVRARKAFEPLFAKHGVDLYVGAHKHYYERLGGIGVDGSACTPPASGCTTYVVHGSAGNNEGVQKKGTGKNADLVQGSDYAAQGFLEFEVANASTAFVRFIRSVDGAVGDEGVLRR